jgi:hypothetical protein
VLNNTCHAKAQTNTFQTLHHNVSLSNGHLYAHIAHQIVHLLNIDSISLAMSALSLADIHFSNALATCISLLSILIFHSHSAVAVSSM